MTRKAWLLSAVAAVDVLLLVMCLACCAPSDEGHRAQHVARDKIRLRTTGVAHACPLSRVIRCDWNAAVLELADRHGSGPCGSNRVGSNPTRGILPLTFVISPIFH